MRWAVALAAVATPDGGRGGGKAAFVLALVAAASLAGCSSPLFPAAWLDAHEGAKIKESIAVRFELTNAQSSGDLKVHRHEFSLQGGTGMFTCTNRAWKWDILDDRDPSENAVVPTASSLEGYLEFALCPDVAGPYTLIWDGAEHAQTGVEVRLLDSEAPLDPIEILAHARNETSRLG